MITLNSIVCYLAYATQKLIIVHGGKVENHLYFAVRLPEPSHQPNAINLNWKAWTILNEIFAQAPQYGKLSTSLVG